MSPKVIENVQPLRSKEDIQSMREALQQTLFPSQRTGEPMTTVQAYQS